MAKQTFKYFNKQLNWSSKLYVLLVLSTVGLAVYFEAWNNYWLPTILGAIAIVSFVDFLGISINRHPAFWKKVGWLLLVFLMALLFTAGFGLNFNSH